MKQGNGTPGLLRPAGILGAGTLAVGLLLISPPAAKAQDGASAATDTSIHVAGLDSAQAAALAACRRLQAYGKQAATNKLKTLRETGVLAKTVDSVMGAIQRTGRYNETLLTLFGLTTLPDSIKPLATTAGSSCKLVPAQATVQQLMQAELSRLPRIGVGVEPLNKQTAAATGLSDTLGLLVSAVAPGLGAQAAGIVAGDVIVSIDDKPVQSIAQLREVSASWKAGDKVNVEVVRKGNVHQKMSVTVMVKG